MANITHGMNVGEVRNQVKMLNTHAASIESVIGKLDSTLQALGNNWKGKDFSEFQGWWNQQHKPALKKLADNIHGLATAASSNADRQDEVSGKA